MERRRFLRGLPFGLILLLGFSPLAGSQEVPTWEVGDSWAMGKEDYDISPLLNLIFENMQKFLPGVSFTGNGTVDFYNFREVVGEDATQYVLSVVQGFGLDANISASGNYQGKRFSGSFSMSMSVVDEGVLNVNKSDLSIARGVFSLEMNFDISGEGIPFIVNFTGSGDCTVSFDPPIDTFDFPISVGENWQVQSTMTMSASFKFTGDIPGLGQLPTEFSRSTEISAQARCTGVTPISVPGGRTVNAYKIEFTDTTWPLLGTTIYYSPEEKQVVAQEIDFNKLLSEGIAWSGEELNPYTFGLSGATGGELLFLASPMAKSEVSEAIEGLRVRGITLLPLALAIVIVLGIIVIAIVALKRPKP
jgi:hypothetical protein